MSDLSVGARAEADRIFTKEDLIECARLAGKETGVVTDEVPGALIGGIFSYLLGTKLPGNGTIYLKQKIRFHAAARPGIVLTGSVEITNIRPEKRLVTLRTVCRDAAGQLICDGEALVLVKKDDQT